MPRKRITLIVIPTNDGQVHEFRLPRGAIWSAVFAGVAIVVALGFYARGFYQRLDQHEALDRLRSENADLLRGLDLTRATVDRLEETMGSLAADDERLRAYHMMESLTDDERIGGVGGSEELPEDYTALPPHKRSLLDDLNARIFRLQQETKAQTRSFADIQQRYLESEGDLRHLPTISPVPRDKTWISSGFGYRTDPFTGRRAFHSGIDFAGRAGTDIKATADGIVTYAYEDIRLGKVIVIEHDIHGEDENGDVFVRQGVYRTEYGHLSELGVRKGQRVRRGQVIGAMGSTGRSTGPHLHYAVRFQDRRLGKYKGYENPEYFLLDEVPGDAKVANWWQKED